MLQQSTGAEWSWLMMQSWLPPQIYSFLCHHNYQTLLQHPLLPLHYHHHQCCCLQSIIWSWVRTLFSHLVEHQSCIRLQQSTCSSIFHSSQSCRGQALHWDTGCLPSYSRLGSISRQQPWSWFLQLSDVIPCSPLQKPTPGYHWPTLAPESPWSHITQLPHPEYIDSCSPTNIHFTWHSLSSLFSTGIVPYMIPPSSVVLFPMQDQFGSLGSLVQAMHLNPDTAGKTRVIKVIPINCNFNISF